MNDFDYENKQKKDIAHSAQRRVGQRRGCTLPSDYLTAAQKKALSGPVTSVKLDEPMAYKDFKGLSEDLQRAYIENLQTLYGASDAMLAEMFGISASMGYTVRKGLGLPAVDRKRPTNEVLEVRHARWRAFLNGVVGGKPGTEEPKLVACEAPGTAADALPEKVSNPIGFETKPEEKKPEPMTTSFVSFEMEGDLEPGKVMDWLKLIKNAIPGKVRLEVRVEQFKEDKDNG